MPGVTFAFPEVLQYIARPDQRGSIHFAFSTIRTDRIAAVHTHTAVVCRGMDFGCRLAQPAIAISHIVSTQEFG